METNQSNQKIGFFDQKAIDNIKKAKNALQKVTLWTFIGGVVMSGFLIMLGSVKESEVIAKLVGTLFTLAVMMLISVVNFKGMESKKKTAQGFGVVGLFANVVWSSLWILSIWGIVNIIEPCVSGRLIYLCETIFTPIGAVAVATAYLSGIGFFGSIICMLYEGTRKSIIKPLKITALACLIYADVYYAYITILIGDTSNYYKLSEIHARLFELAGFATFVFFVSLVIAAILAKQEKNKVALDTNKKRQKLADHAIEQLNAKGSDNKEKYDSSETYDEPMVESEDDIRAEIEAKVRREMEEKAMRERIEKEVREKVEKEMKEKAE